MKSKALWFGLLAVGVVDWLALNLVAGPAYFASAAPADAQEPAAPAELVPLGTKPVEAKPVEPAETAPMQTAPVETASPKPSAPEPPPAEVKPAETDAAAAAPEPESSPADALPPLDPLHFGRQSAEISEEGRRSLNALGAYLLANPHAIVTIDGHADKRGKPEFNDWLSEQRARAVRTYLHGLGVPFSRMRVEAHGSSRPTDTSGTEAARAKNRRVELSVNQEP